MKKEAPVKLKFGVIGPKYSCKTRFCLAFAHNSYNYYGTRQLYEKEVRVKLRDGVRAAKVELVDNASEHDSYHGMIVAFDATTRTSLEEAKALVEKQLRAFPERPVVLTGMRCDLYRPLLFDNWGHIRELLVVFKAKGYDYGCAFAALNVDVMSVILEFLADSSIAIQGYPQGALFALTRNCTGRPISRWECRAFARKNEIGVTFASGKEDINVSQTVEMLVSKVFREQRNFIS